MKLQDYHLSLIDNSEINIEWAQNSVFISDKIREEEIESKEEIYNRTKKTED